MLETPFKRGCFILCKYCLYSCVISHDYWKCDVSIRRFVYPKTLYIFEWSPLLWVWSSSTTELDGAHSGRPCIVFCCELSVERPLGRFRNVSGNLIGWKNQWALIFDFSDTSEKTSNFFKKWRCWSYDNNMGGKATWSQVSLRAPKRWKVASPNKP
jgi:hypothetical protein